jgi:hypothetical protein
VKMSFIEKIYNYLFFIGLAIAFTFAVLGNFIAYLVISNTLILWKLADIEAVHRFFVTGQNGKGGYKPIGWRGDPIGHAKAGRLGGIATSRNRKNKR